MVTSRLFIARSYEQFGNIDSARAYYLSLGEQYTNSNSAEEAIDRLDELWHSSPDSTSESEDGPREDGPRSTEDAAQLPPQESGRGGSE